MINKGCCYRSKSYLAKGGYDDSKGPVRERGSGTQFLQRINTQVCVYIKMQRQDTSPLLFLLNQHFSFILFIFLFQ